MPTRYDKEFKQNIINLYKQGESAAQLAREYGIGYSTVHKWIQGQAKTQSGKSPDEIKAMEKRLASLSEENEILKKALGFLRTIPLRVDTLNNKRALLPVKYTV